MSKKASEWERYDRMKKLQKEAEAEKRRSEGKEKKIVRSKVMYGGFNAKGKWMNKEEEAWDIYVDR